MTEGEDAQTDVSVTSLRHGFTASPWQRQELVAAYLNVVFLYPATISTAGGWPRKPEGLALAP